MMEEKEAYSMDIRTLHYFLTVAREASITGAAEFLHMTQPPLSRQLKDLEEELGVQLMIRGSRKITLTEEGMILRKRAEEIIELLHKTEREVTSSRESVTGDVYIGGGETDAIRLIAKAARSLQKIHPQIHYHISSGDAKDVMERLDKGLIDFGILLDFADITKYQYLRFPDKDVWGVLMRRDSPLAEKDAVAPEDLWDKPLMVSRQTLNSSQLPNWLGKDFSQLDVVLTYTLIYNASLLVDEGFGYAFCLDKLINTKGTSLCFKPLCPRQEIGLSIVWKKHQVFSKAAEKFLEQVKKELAAEGADH